MNILVTGAAGFLGSHLCDVLLMQQHRVIGVDNMSLGDIANLRTAQNNWGFTFYHGDCRNYDTMLDIMQREQIDIVYHLAATAHEGLSVFSPSFITKNIYEASVAVFSAACQTKVKRIIFASSMSRYGHGEGEGAFHEEMLPAPSDPYAIAKVAAEDTLKCLCETHGIEYVITVPHNIIGVRQNYTDPHRNVASIMMNRLKQGKDLVIYGDGEQTRCFSPVTDNIGCLIRTADLSDKRIVGSTINIGPDERGAITINELARKIYRLSGKVFSPVYYPDRPREVKHAVCTADKARELLDYRPKQSLDDCLAEMWDCIPEGGKPFVYDDKPLEIVNHLTPITWVQKLI